MEVKFTGSSQTFTVKYVIKANFNVEGVVEKPDIIGAVFGQTEGLFGPELDLRELQKSGRIGRIEIELNSNQDKTTGSIKIPTSLDRVSTSLIAASVESINRVGPCASKVNLEKIGDVREARRRLIIGRAKAILHQWTIDSMPSVDEVFKEVSDTIKLSKVEKFGPEKLSAGPEIHGSNEIIIVEGRADIINLMRCGILNTIALEGAKIPETIKKISKERESTAFLDGDRGGDLILKELMQVTKVKSIARAPRGKEVEELNCREIFEALKLKLPINDLKTRKSRQKVTVPKKAIIPKKTIIPKTVTTPKEFNEIINKLEGTLEAILLNAKLDEIQRLPVSQLANNLQIVEDVKTVIFDGVITQRIIDIACKKKIETIIASRKSQALKSLANVNLMLFSEIKTKK